MKIITLGTFDLLHYGHIKLLNKCELMSYPDFAVGLNTDDFVKLFKGKKPSMSYNERRDSIESLFDCKIIANDQLTGDAKDVIKRSRANLIVIGSDWARKDYLKQLGITWDWLEENDIGLCYLPYTKGISSTKIKTQIMQ